VIFHVFTNHLEVGQREWTVNY